MKQGTYAGIKLHPTSENEILRYITNNNIPNGVSRAELHVTLIRSVNNLPNFDPILDISSNAVVLGNTEFQATVTGEITRCLVFLLGGEYLGNRFDELIKEHSAVHEFQSYVPHLTLSYDLERTRAVDLPSFVGDIMLSHEYSYPLTQ